jgi:hypothetical protein
MPNDRIDKIHELMLQQKDEFFKYAQQDNRDKQEILNRINTLTGEAREIRIQVTETNGKVKVLRLDVDKLQNLNNKQIIVTKINKKWLATIGAAAIFVIQFFVHLLQDFVKKHF